MNVTYSNESIQMDEKELTSFFSLQYLSYFFEMQTQRNTVYIVGENHEEPKGITWIYIFFSIKGKEKSLMQIF